MNHFNIVINIDQSQLISIIDLLYNIHMRKFIIKLHEGIKMRKRKRIQ